MIEFYEAFGNSKTMKETTEDIIRSTVMALFGKLQVEIPVTEFKSVNETNSSREGQILKLDFESKFKEIEVMPEI